MPDPIRQRLQEEKVRVPDTSDRERPVEAAWNEYSVLAYEGLMPTQIVRRITEKEGLDRWEATRLPFRTDARPDTDDKRQRGVPFLPDDPTRYVDERRYIVDPVVGKHRFRGLWTGGPVRMTTDKRSGAREVTQVLTLTLCAGHGYKKDENGNYVCAYKVGNRFNTKLDGSGEDIPAEEVRDYQTVDDALRHSRAALGARLFPYMANRKDIPSSYTREVQWREFTHESMQFLDSLGIRPENHARLADVVAYHFYELAGEAVTNAACRVDAETNTVIFTAAITYTKLGEPSDPSELLALPCIETCDRDTLRMFGWGQLEDGEGYKYTHVFKWPRLKDTPEVRRALEFVRDNAPTHDVYAETDDGSDSDSDADSVLLVPAAPSFVLGLLRQHGLLPAAGDPLGAHAWFGDGDYEKRFPVEKNTDQIDATGRLVTSATALSHTEDEGSDGDVETTPSTADVPVQTYRVAKQRVEPDEDGSISFVIAVSKAEWHGGDDGEDWETVKPDGKHGSRVLAGVSAPQGYGRSEHRVVPSVPRQNAIPTMEGIRPKNPYEIIVEKRQTEGTEGASDVSFQRKTLYDYVNPEHTPENLGPDTVAGNIFNAPSYNYDPSTNTYRLGWDYVASQMVQTLIDSAKSKLGGNPVVDTVYHPEGYYTVRIVGKGKEPKHIVEWCVAADWFKHETQESWLGVTVELDQNGRPTGFYREYQKNADGSYALDNEGNLIPIGGLVSFATIRGDLDANWMGSDPQHTASNPRNPAVSVTTGAAAGNVEGAKIALSGAVAPLHDDEHGDGWSAGAWADPDFGDGASEAGDAADKLRSHAIARVSPRRNQDGSYDIVISRIYPHQRYWEWETQRNNGRKSGEWKPVYHAEYRNWPSRKAIYDDLVKRFADKRNIDLDGDDYTYAFSPNVNEFGLVDARDVTITPLFWNSGKGKHKQEADDKEQNLSEYRFKNAYALKDSVGVRIRPGAAAVVHRPAFAPLLGYYFEVERKGCYVGSYSTLAAAEAAFYAHGAPGEGSVMPHQASAGVFTYVWRDTDFVESNVWYNGEKPVAAEAEAWKMDARTQEGHTVGSGVTSGQNGLSRATWELWFKG